MSKQPHHQQGSPSGSGGNSGRRTGAEPRIQAGAGMSKQDRNVGQKTSATKPRRKAA